MAGREAKEIANRSVQDLIPHKMVNVKFANSTREYTYRTLLGVKIGKEIELLMNGSTKKVVITGYSKALKDPEHFKYKWIVVKGASPEWTYEAREALV